MFTYTNENVLIDFFFFHVSNSATERTNARTSNGIGKELAKKEMTMGTY